MEILHEGFGDSKYRPCPLLRKYVKAGWLGKKSGRGFYVRINYSIKSGLTNVENMQEAKYMDIHIY